MATYQTWRNGLPARVSRQFEEEYEQPLGYQPYRTTPLILPGAKVKKDNAGTESYLRHHPNPNMRAHPSHDFHDHAMKQRVADSVLHRVVGDDPNKVIRKQFNTPIGLYSDSNIEKAIHQTVPIFIDLSFLKQKQKILEQQQGQTSSSFSSPGSSSQNYFHSPHRN